MVHCPPVHDECCHTQLVFVACTSCGRDGYPAPYAHVPPLCGASPSDSLCDRLTGRAKPMPKDVEGFITVQAGKPMTAHLVQYREEKRKIRRAGERSVMKNPERLRNGTALSPCHVLRVWYR